MGVAYAMGGFGGGAGNPPGGMDWGFMMMIAALFAIFYFMLIRPQQKQQKEHKEMLTNLSHGDTVLTNGGIHGKIVAITDNIITLEVADKVRIKVGRNFIGAVLQKSDKE
jgi:preprotein translocase subunit YajC